MSQFVVRRRSPAAPVALTLLCTTFPLLAVAAFTGHIVPFLAAALVLAFGLAFSMGFHRVPWGLTIGVLVLVILFIPIRRYTFPGNLPFALEPYRIVVALILTAWIASLLVDRRVRLRRTFLDPPVALLALAIAGSLAVNMGRVASLQSDVLKSVTFFASFILLFYLVASVLRPRAGTALVHLLLIGAAVVAFLAILEYQTGWNPYDRVLGPLPFLQFNEPAEFERAAGVNRAFGSAEHPIALGGMFAMLIPLALFAAKTSGRRVWWIVLLLLALGALATVSRTSVLMLGAAGAVVLWLRPREVRKLLPVGLAVFILAQAAVPGSLGTLRYFFFPDEGLIAQQQSSAGSCTSAGRIADLRPSLAEYSHKPILGYGFGTRLVTGERANACILDNQWLGSLLEIGAVGVFALVWLFARSVRRLARQAREPTTEGWLAASLAASVAAYAAGMLTFDSFGFIQVTFLLWILLAVGAAIASGVERPDRV